ncbi:TPA: molecular chaperone DnaK [Candidatus Sumerlaeota bacterium]|jgi:molecular chaperone DnaK|nr:molecular chaperone DnaK [Candidatus Sumerlaeota bacterium]
MPSIIGIDLGTTNSVVGFMDKNGPIIVPSSSGDRLTPSVVGFTKNGDILVGKKARRGAIMNVGRTIFSAKRYMGTDHRFKIDSKEYTPQEISAIVLQKLKQDAEEYFGEDIPQAVITVPAYFTDAQRQATKDAGEIAGFNVRRIIDEPTAAAMAYGADKKKDQTLLVYDLGGGTFDVSIIEIFSGVFRVLGINGNTQLGGDDFDNVIVRYLVQEFQKAEGVNLTEDPVAMQRLKEVAEETKIELSESRESHILCEAITMGPSGPLTLEMVMTRDQFESLIRPMVDSTQGPIEKALADAGLRKEQVDTVLLVGGSTRIPMVQQFVKKMMGGVTPQRDISPEEVVALGAALQTQVLAPLENDLDGSLATHYNKEKMVVVHMTPFSLGVGLEDDQMGIIIERNSTYPSEKKDIYSTTRDFQEAISFPIYEGESNRASENTFLDLLRIEGITPAPKGVPRIEVTFRLSPDRILEARAEDLATGLEKVITIQSTSTKLDEKQKKRMEAEAKERVTNMLRAKVSDTVEGEAKETIARAKAALDLNGGHALAGKLRESVNNMQQSFDAHDMEKLETQSLETMRLLAQLESAEA